MVFLDFLGSARATSLLLSVLMKIMFPFVYSPVTTGWKDAQNDCVLIPVGYK